MDAHVFRFCDNEMLSHPEWYTQEGIFNPKPLADAYWAEYVTWGIDCGDPEAVQYSAVLQQVINWYYKAPIAFQYELAPAVVRHFGNRDLSQL